MIFSISSVCLAYALGIVACTVYIRRLRLVGAGFFWLMWSTSLMFIFLSIISSDGYEKVAATIGLGTCFFLLINSVIKRAQIREKISLYERVFLVFTLIFIVSAELNIVSSDFGGLSFIRESSRLIVGGLLLGVITSTMLLGHWYLVQPGLTRKPIGQLCKLSMGLLLIDICLWLVPTSMASVISGSVSDGWGGTLGYMWVGSSITTAGLLFVAYKALQEKSYSAVMATTGLLYLAILVANGVELIPRAIFS